MNITYQQVIYKKEQIAVLRKARRDFKCNHCKEAINKGNLYYSITIGGGGLLSLKFPDRVHPDFCIDKYFE